MYCEKGYLSLLLLFAVKAAQAQSNSNIPIKFPVDFSNLVSISSPYGYRQDPFTGKFKMHRGIDIASAAGTKVVASGSGMVTKCARTRSYGNYVIVKHRKNVKTLYAHLLALVVKEGDSVRQGQVVGYVGKSGRATGYHLHFEILIDGKRVNPIFFWNRFAKKKIETVKKSI